MFSPKSKRWFDNGKNSENKTVCNPTIGYGEQTLKYANGNTKEFFQIGLSANASGISVYIMGLPNKVQLKNRFEGSIGKAKVTGYCIQFKKLSDINVAVLEEAIQFGFETSQVS